jgi:hypothetical protein
MNNNNNNNNHKMGHQEEKLGSIDWIALLQDWKS